MHECPMCGKRFLTRNARDGHKAECPEKEDRWIPDEYQGPYDGRFRVTRENTES